MPPSIRTSNQTNAFPFFEFSRLCQFIRFLLQHPTPPPNPAVARPSARSQASQIMQSDPFFAHTKDAGFLLTPDPLPQHGGQSLVILLLWLWIPGGQGR